MAYVASVGNTAVVTSGNLTLTEPSGAASGDLLIAFIAARGNAAFTLPSGWTIIDAAENSGNTSTTASSGIGSGLVAYIIRGGSAPALTWNRTAGDVGFGRIIAVRGHDPTTPIDVAFGNTMGAASTSIAAGVGLTTTNPGALLLMGIMGGADITVSGYACATAPVAAEWRELADSLTTSGADTTLAIAMAWKGAAGATGNFSATGSVSTRNCIFGFAVNPDPAGTFPYVAGIRAGVDATAPAPTINLPNGIQSGDLILIGTAHGAGPDDHSFSGFTRIADGNTNLDTDGCPVSVFAKAASGSEGGSISGANFDEGPGYWSMIVRNWGGNVATDIAVSAETQSDTAATTFDPANLTSGFGAVDTLWLAFGGGEFTSRTVSTWPTNYIPGAENGTPFVAVAFRPLNAASENPGAITASGNVEHRSSFTLAIKPAANSIDVDGALASQAAVIAGTVGVTVNVTGALAAQAASIAGVVSPIINVTGALASGAPTLAAELNVIKATGALASQDAVIAGVVSININATGALASPAASTSGAIEVKVNATGALASAAAAIAGTVGVTVNAQGALAAAAAAIAGVASPKINATGALSSQSASIAGTVGITISVAGALAAQAASIAGIYSTVEAGTITATGALVAQSAAVAGVVSPIVSVNGALVSDAPAVSGVVSPKISLTGDIVSGAAFIAGEYRALEPLLFSGNLLAQPASMSGIFIKLKLENPDFVSVFKPDKHRFRFLVRRR